MFQNKSISPILRITLINQRLVFISVRVHKILTLIPEQINTCESQHDALVRAGTRSSPGYAVSGTLLVICSRHCMIRKNGAGDLQLSEKYVLSMLLSAL